MRTALTLLLGASASMASAQIVNGGFEDGLNGWTIPACQEAVVSVQWMPGLGVSCLGLGVPVDGDCFFQSPVHQFTPWLTPGQWELRGWMAGNGIGGQNQGAYVQIKAMAGPVNPIAALSGFDYMWTYHTCSFEIGMDISTDSLRVVLYQDLGALQYTLFDELEILPATPTSVSATPDLPLPFRPNPAADKLWIDLPDMPLSIIAIDASGRTHDLKNFTHRDHTFEVDVSSLPAGITSLRITTNLGTQNLRFLKM